MKFDDSNLMVLPRFVSNALYITDLNPNFVSEDILFNLFSQVGTVLSVKLYTNPKSSGDSPLPSHAYINYNTVEEACIAWQTLNYKDLNGTPMRIMFSNLDPASRYNHNANLIIQNLEQSIDSEALHHTFSAIGVVISSKVKRDRRGNSLGYGFIQFQDEEDAQRAIRLVNGKLLEGKQVYLGPFIPRSTDGLESTTNLNPLDLNPAHRTVPVQIERFRTIHEVVSSMNVGDSGNSLNSNVSRASDHEVGSGSEVDDKEPSSDDNDDDEARFRARAADMIKTAREAILAEKRAALPHIDPSYVPSLEPWPPQPWSVETLKANLASAHLPEERLAMLGSTLLPLVWKYTESYASDVTNELVKMNIEDIVHLMESAGALHKKVEATKKTILEKIRNQAPIAPKTPPKTLHAVSTPAPAAPSTLESADEAPALAQEPGVDPISVMTVALLPLQIGTGVFQVGIPSKFRKGTGFFDVSRDLALPHLQRSK